MLKSVTTWRDAGKDIIDFPILVVNDDGDIFLVTKSTNGKVSPCINAYGSSRPNLYTSTSFNIARPFPQEGYDLFEGSVTITQEL